jgi:hypothetical protein
MTLKFPSFLDDDAVHDAAEAHWHQLFEGLSCRPLEHGWRVWHGKNLRKLRADGASDIYAAGLDATHRPIQIVQCLPDPNEPNIVAWMAVYEEGFGEHAIDYLKITLTLTDETEKIALTLLERFVCGGATPAQMNDLILELGVQ